jgi:ParB family chromosome partitioning protein
MNKQPQRIEYIPINKIRVTNPRARNMITFQSIVSNIGKVGLKKPITVTRRAPDADGTEYDLGCGEGRLKALVALGETMVPAIVINATPEQRHLISLVENIARRRPSTLELVREVRSLMNRGYNSPAIAAKIGKHRTYVQNVVRLLRKGEEKLIGQVEAGILPLGIAVKIAGAASQDVQKALNEAYESGDLRGSKFRAVQSLVTRRFAKGPGVAEKSKNVSGKDIVREYEKHTQRHRALVRRAGIVAQRLALLRASMKRLLTDEHFVTLLRAESLHQLPQALTNKRLA